MAFAQLGIDTGKVCGLHFLVVRSVYSLIALVMSHENCVISLRLEDVQRRTVEMVTIRRLLLFPTADDLSLSLLLSSAEGI